MGEKNDLIPKAIAAFKADRTAEEILAVLDLLKNSTVWIPCNAVMSESDQEQLEEFAESAGDDPQSLVGQVFHANDQVRLIPDILRNADGYFFPVFSSQEEMGEYGKGFSKLAQPFLDVITVAKNNERDLVGIVVNAFTDPLVLPWNVLDIIENPDDGEEL